ncbi:unnamed protein product [Durusdinium trenchii]|uniref:Uncharacterized protein n=1 Tax=Durusdinium trenchii TaxID=1381693 RepID=A0ABP0QRM6_9DINO
MPCRVLPMSFAGPAVALQLVHQSKQHEWYAKVPAQATLTTVVILTMFTKGLRPEALRFHATDGTLLQDIPIADALATASQIECLLWTFPLLLIRAQSPPAASRPAPHADEIPPTVPFSAREDESLIIALDSSPAYRLSPELFQEMLCFLEFNTRWALPSNSNRQIVSLLWEPTLGVLTIALDSTVPAADLQEQLATHFGPHKHMVYQSPFPIRKIAPGPLFTVRDRNHSNNALVMFQKLQTEVWVRAHVVPKEIERSTKITTQEGLFQIVHHNDRPCTGDRLHLANGDWLLIEPVLTDVVVGGHHRWTTNPEVLPRGANFTDRISFSINTHGWAASDELHAAMMWLLRRFPETIAEFNILQWHTAEQEFSDELYGEPRFAESGRAVTAVLVDNHWAAIEVNIIGHHTQVHTFGLGANLAQRAMHMICRRMDVTPQRVQQHIHPAQPPEHLCGWFLLQRYYILCQALHQLPDTMNQFNDLPAFRRGEIREAWEAAQEDWRRAGASDNLMHFATALRTNFLVNLAITATRDSSVVNVPLHVQFPAQLAPTARPLHTGQQAAPSQAQDTPEAAPLQPAPIDPAPQQPDRVHIRLLESLGRPGWLSSDTLDHALESLRWHCPQICFCPPAQWISDDQSLRFLAGLECLHDTFSQIILFVLWREHWILCELHVHAWEVFIQTVGPIEILPDLHLLVAAVCRLFRLHNLVLNTAATHFAAPVGLCGWSLLRTPLRRFQVPLPQLSQLWLAALRVHRLQALIRQVQVAETNLWETQGDPDLLQFASGIALEFLVHIIQNRFPNERNVGGALNDTGHQLPIPHLPPVGSATPQLRVQERLNLFDTRPGWLFSDTADYLLDFLREADPDTVYLPPMQWTSQGVSAFNDLCSPIQASQKAIGLILWEQHWILCEFQSTADFLIIKLQEVIAKLPSAARSTLLSLSGQQGILLRDFLDSGSQPIDTSVIPKFWEVSQKGLRELSISIEGVKGIAGAILTRRGLAIRAWTANIAEVRRKLLPNDARLNDTNIAVVPRHMMDAAGWPPGASPADVIESVTKAVSQAPIPTRTFRSAGVHTWQLGFQTLPHVQTFTVKINGSLHQILLTPTPFHSKGNGKGKQRPPKKGFTKDEPHFPPAATSIAAASAQQDKKRIDQLENRFDSLQKQVTGIEHKQTSLESKLDQRFNDIGDTLRQLVQLSTNRAHEPSGESPPPKNQRIA